MKNITLVMATSLLLMLLISIAVGEHGGGGAYCPAVALDQVGICITDCNSDRDCKGTEKCCQNGCGKLCTKAVTSKPGDCPAIDDDNIICVDQMNPCQTDMDCGGVEKCCWTGCSPVCMKPAPRDGMCPYTAPNPEIQCDWYDECGEDNECGWPKKCCAGLCGNTCVQPEMPKPGICPATEEGGFGICSEECRTDNECEGSQKCCTNGCGHACSLPATNTCYVGGKHYLPGPVPDPNGCNTCTCTEGGVVCTEMACNCEIKGKEYLMGESYQSYREGDECNTCKCRGYNDNLGDDCTDYYCGGPEKHGMKKHIIAVIAVSVGVVGIIVVIAVLLGFYLVNKRNTAAQKKSQVQGKQDEQAGPLPVKTNTYA